MKVITYNILTSGRDLLPFKGSWWLSRALRQRKFLIEKDADVICLQECGLSQCLVFMTMWGYRVRGLFSQDPIFYKKDLKCIGGTTKRIVSAKYPRWYNICVLNDGKQDYCIANTHLDWDVETHCRQKELVEGTMSRYDGKRIVCGDFNKTNDDFYDLIATDYNGYSFDNGNMQDRIDYIFSEEKSEAEVCYDAYQLSDHYPLIVDLYL